MHRQCGAQTNEPSSTTDWVVNAELTDNNAKPALSSDNTQEVAKIAALGVLVLWQLVRITKNIV